MRNIELEQKISQEKVCGVNAYNLRDGIKKAFANQEYIPDHYKNVFTDQDSDMFLTILDVAAFAAQCSIRRANGLEVPV